MKRRFNVVVVLLVGLITAILLGACGGSHSTVRASSSANSPKVPPPFADTSVTAPKHPTPAPATCARQAPPGPPSGLISAATGAPQPVPAAVLTMTNGAYQHAASDSNWYQVYAGADGQNPNQGVIVVWKLDPDPCAHHTTDSQPQAHDAPGLHGAVSITDVNGDTVVWRANDGTTGRFNLVTGQY
jgi:hypothetical protein